MKTAANGRQRLDLNEGWQLGYLRQAEWKSQDQPIRTSGDFRSTGKRIYPATVPGTLETALMDAGELPDLYVGLNVLEAQKYEDCHVYYFKTFSWIPSQESNPVLVFEGIDTVAEIYLNGELLEKTDNMFLEHRMIPKNLKSGENELLIHIIPACVAAREYELLPGNGCSRYNAPTLHLRKAPHMFGWDICPRIVSAGLWKPVYIELLPKERIEDLYFMTFEENGEGGTALVDLYFRLNIESGLLDRYELHAYGVCGESSFDFKERLWFTQGTRWFPVQNAKLWWPKNRGEQSLYEVHVELLKDGLPVDSRNMKVGLRSVELLRTGITDSKRSGKFEIRVNQEKVFITGTNWVPADAIHSNDRSRIEKMLDLAEECGCNAIRCWGGNVYEDDLFYTLCDEKGILVWQDFAMACGVYPQDLEMQEKLRFEAAQVVRRLRGHCSIALWSGDNECDMVMGRTIGKRDPNINKLTRQILKDVLDMEDPTRPYLPSSPYYDEEGYLAGRRMLTENHLWGPRDYYKSTFYTQSRCHFVSEIGYHGCPSPESVRKFITPEKVWPWQDNEEWMVHAANPEKGKGAEWSYRVKLMADQVGELFGVIPDNLEEFSLASQISQAEAKKFFIELFRQQNDVRTGIIWWNLIDCWPQFSDAVVDYYYDKKLAFDYIKRSQQPFCLLMAEPDNWNCKLYAVNDTKNALDFDYEVLDVTCGNRIVASGHGTAKPDSRLELGAIPFSQSDKKFYLMRWSGERQGINHYLAGNPPFKLQQYLELARKAGILTGD